MTISPNLVANLVVAAISIAGTAAASRNYWVDKVEHLSKESQHFQEVLRHTESTLAEARADLASEMQESSAVRLRLGRLQARYNELNARYQLAIQVEGTEPILPSLDDQWHVRDLHTGGALPFKLSASTVDARMIRVTHDGAVVQIQGCEHPKITYGVAAPKFGRHCFLVAAGSDLQMLISTRCCERGFHNADHALLEHVRIQCQEYDVTDQTALFRFRKCFMEE